MRRKALFFLPSSTGGAERMTITIGKMLPMDDFEVKFIIVGRNTGSIGRFIPSEYTTEFLYISNVWDFFTLKLMRIMRRERPHVVFCSLMVYNSRVALAAHFIGGIKIVIRNNNDFTNMRKDKLLLCKATYPLANVIIAQQEEMMQDIIKHIPKVADKIVVLQNPVDVSTIKAKANAPSPFPPNLKQRECNYVCVARFTHAKGQDVLAKAFAILAKKNKDAHLYFIGKYDENDHYCKQVKQIVIDSGLDDRVHFVGFDDDPYRWMRHCNCLVLPSRREGLPNVLIEAQYLGIPVAATESLPVIRRIVKEGINGYTAPSDNPKALAEAMEKAITLHDVPTTYKSAEPSEFIKLFR